MKKISLALIMLIIVGICIPAVSAETIIDEEFAFYEDTGGTYNTLAATYSGSEYPRFNTFEFKNIENHPDLAYVAVLVKPDQRSSLPADGVYEFTYTGLNGTKTGRYHVEKSRNLLGIIISYRYVIFFDDWDIGTQTGAVNIKISEPLYSSRGRTPTGNLNPVINIRTSYNNQYESEPYTITIASTVTWKNRIIVNDDISGSYAIDLQRIYGSKSCASTIDILKGSDIKFTEGSSDDFWTMYPKNEIDLIKITALGQVYNVPLGSSGDTDTPSAVTVYIRNSQTDALLANANLVISANVNGNFHEVANETVPSGIYSIDLQPTGGGLPNPDFYRLIVTAEGYNSIMPYIDFEFKEAATIYAILDPIGGAPEDENNTFIDFYVRDMSANPISGATVNFGGYTLITNNAGYTIFEVDKSKTYSWTVSKSGYGSLTGNAVIGIAPRHTINTVLAPAVTPTTPTAIPTSTSISPTPTMTAPTGEPVSNWLEWFAAHFGMILGGGAEIGKIFMWLCFSVPVGVYVGKEAKAGAAGFMAGAGVVTLFFVLIGWVPIWLLVFIALIIGLLYAKVFNNSDNGGGR